MSTAARVFAAILGVLLFAQGLGKALDVPGYLHALSTYPALPADSVRTIGIVWLLVELASGLGLIYGAVSPRPPWLPRIPAVGACVVATAYLILTAGAWVRGIDIPNCTCFGTYLPQRLSFVVLIQEAVVLFVSAWILRSTEAAQSK